MPPLFEGLMDSGELTVIDIEDKTNSNLLDRNAMEKEDNSKFPSPGLLGDGVASPVEHNQFKVCSYAALKVGIL